MMAMHPDPVRHCLVSVVAHASNSGDPQWLRCGLIAESLLARYRDLNEGGLARAMGYTGSVGVPGRTGIAMEAIRLAQATLDAEEPDLPTVKTGIAAARVLIGTKNTQRRDGGNFLFGLMLGKTGGLAPKHLSVAEDA